MILRNRMVDVVVMAIGALLVLSAAAAFGEGDSSPVDVRVESVNFNLVTNDDAELLHTTRNNGYASKSAPAITGMSPNIGWVFGAEEVTIQGQGFSDADELTVIVEVTDADGTDFSTEVQLSAVTDTEIVFTAPPLPLGGNFPDRTTEATVLVDFGEFGTEEAGSFTYVKWDVEGEITTNAFRFATDAGFQEVLVFDGESHMASKLDVPKGTTPFIPAATIGTLTIPALPPAVKQTTDLVFGILRITRGGEEFGVDSNRPEDDIPFPGNEIADIFNFDLHLYDGEAPNDEFFVAFGEGTPIAELPTISYNVEDTGLNRSMIPTGAVATWSRPATFDFTFANRSMNIPPMGAFKSERTPADMRPATYALEMLLVTEDTVPADENAPVDEVRTHLRNLGAGAFALRSGQAPPRNLVSALLGTTGADQEVSPQGGDEVIITGRNINWAVNLFAVPAGSAPAFTTPFGQPFERTRDDATGRDVLLFTAPTLALGTYELYIELPSGAKQGGLIPVEGWLLVPDGDPGPILPIIHADNFIGPEFVTSLQRFRVTGNLPDGTSQLLVNGVPQFFDPNGTSWSVTIDLLESDPPLLLEVIAVDSNGNQLQLVSVTIVYDETFDIDGNGLTDQEEAEIAHLIPTDPLDPLLPRSDWFVSAASGSDVPAIDGGGTEDNPWRTIHFAMGQLEPLARENFPLRILLDDAPTSGDSNAVYRELPVNFVPFVTVEPVATDPGSIIVEPIQTSNTPLIRAADETVLRGVRLRLRTNDPQRTLLEINNVAMQVEDVIFDGRRRQFSTGVDINGPLSSDSAIHSSEFFDLGTGVFATDSGVAVSDNTFENISANGSASRAIAIGFTTGGGKQEAQSPVLGRVDRILDTGFNRFRDLPPGASAIEFVNVPSEITSAQYNDWGVYTEEQIRARISAPFKDDADAVDIFPFIPQDKAIIPGGITGVILDALTNSPIPLNAAPGAVATDTLTAMAEENGLFFFDVLPEGTYSLIGRALNYDDSPARSVRVTLGRVTEAPRFLLTGNGVDPNSRVPGDVNGNGRVDAVDVQLVINAALGIDIGDGMDADINGDGVVNAVDVQLVINAALGIEIEV